LNLRLEKHAYIQGNNSYWTYV